MKNEEIKNRKPKPINYERRYLFRMSEQMYNDLIQYSKDNNITVSDLIRECIKEVIYKDM